MSSRNPNRVPVQPRGRRIPGLYERRFADGTGSVFEFNRDAKYAAWEH